jgi:hypothetical protein
MTEGLLRDAVKRTRREVEKSLEREGIDEYLSGSTSGVSG